MRSASQQATSFNSRSIRLVVEQGRNYLVATAFEDRGPRTIAKKVRGISFSKPLVRLILAELYVDWDSLADLVGPPLRLKRNQYAHALAMAVALPHCWRRDDLARIARHLARCRSHGA
jgi:hypothetical protein